MSAPASSFILLTLGQSSALSVRKTNQQSVR
mgnify:CR=1 FL=1